MTKIKAMLPLVVGLRNGSGSIDNILDLAEDILDALVMRTTEVCSDCNGSGDRTLPDYMDTSDSLLIHCPYCQGTGRTFKDARQRKEPDESNPGV